MLLTGLERVPDRDPDDLVAIARVALVRPDHPRWELRGPPRAAELLVRAGLDAARRDPDDLGPFAHGGVTILARGTAISTRALVCRGWSRCCSRGSSAPAETFPGGGRATPTRSSSPRSCCSRRRWSGSSRATSAGSRAGRPSGALAAASPGDAIREWQGLGYNRRALALHRAAQQVAAAGWPADLTELPGVGPVHGGRDPQLRLRRAGAPGRRERRARAAAHGPFVLAGSRAGADGSRRDHLPRAVPRCDACPLEPACPSRGIREEPARKQGPFAGSFRQRRSATLRLVARPHASVGRLRRRGRALARAGRPRRGRTASSRCPLRSRDR